jgi:hypothetical protein
LHDIGAGGRRIERQLDQAVPIPEVYEEETTQVTPAMDPATEPDGLAQLGAGNRPGSVGSKGGCSGGKFRLKANLRHFRQS